MDRQNRPLTILTIDDEEQIQYALRALFNSQGWEAISARDVEEGVGKFRTCRPDLVLMDYHLPKINGVKGVEMLRREDPEVPADRLHHRGQPAGGRPVPGCGGE